MTRARLARLVAAHRRQLELVAISGAAALLGIWLVVGTAPAPSPTPAPTANAPCGVDRLRIRRTADGHLLDLRYRVVDEARAGSVLAKTSTAYLVHTRTGKRLAVPTTPKAGALRTTGQPHNGRTYFALFSNPGRLVRPGDRVAVVLGELTAELTVE